MLGSDDQAFDLVGGIYFWTCVAFMTVFCFISDSHGETGGKNTTNIVLGLTLGS